MARLPVAALVCFFVVVSGVLLLAATPFDAAMRTRLARTFA